LRLFDPNGGQYHSALSLGKSIEASSAIPINMLVVASYDTVIFGVRISCSSQLPTNGLAVGSSPGPARSRVAETTRRPGGFSERFTDEAFNCGRSRCRDAAKSERGCSRKSAQKAPSSRGVQSSMMSGLARVLTRYRPSEPRQGGRRPDLWPEQPSRWVCFDRRRREAG